MARLMYASPAWWGSLSGGDRDRLERFTHRLRRAGFLPQEAPTVESLANRADDALFKAIISDPKHVLRRMCHDATGEPIQSATQAPPLCPASQG